MIYKNTTAIAAVNSGEDVPDAFYAKSTLIATSKYVSTDGWRGYQEVTPEPGFKRVDSSWLTGDWSDAPTGHSESEVLEQLEQYEAKHGNVYVIFTPTSNVFSTGYDVLIKDKSTKPTNKGKTVAHKTKKFTDSDGSWRIRYHATDVISYDAKTGKYKLDSGGWQTVTTKKRINEYLPGGYYIRQQNFKWYVVDPDGVEVDFKDGLEV